MKPTPVALVAFLLPLLHAAAAAEPVPNPVLLLDGKTGAMVVPDSPAFRALSNAMTLELRFRATSFYPEDGMVNSLLRKNVTPNGPTFFLRFRIVNRKPMVEFCPGKKIGIVRAPFDFEPGKWYHLAATYDGRYANLFVDGTQIQSDARTGPLETDAADLVIGRGDPDYSSGEFFDGALDDIRLWSIARTPEQVAAGQRSLPATPAPGMIARWGFDDATPADQSGSGNRGTLAGAARIVDAGQLPPPRPRSALGGELTIERRLETIEDLWKRLNEIYPALEYKGVTGHAWVEPAIARARQAKNNEEFYDALLELMAGLKDTHTRIVYYPAQTRPVSPPVQLNRVENKIAVVRADPGTGVSPGDVLAAIDGQPAEPRFSAALKRICNSTDLGREREACEHLLRGKPGASVTATFESPDRGTRQLTLQCGGSPEFWSEPTISSRRLSESLGYIRIARWGGTGLVAEFDQALEKFKSCAGLVIDVRGNGGGADELADRVNGRFIDQPVISSIDFWRQAGTDSYKKTIGWVQPRGPWMYQGRVAVLIDEGCASACEHFVSGCEATGRMLLVGRPTNGAGGGPTGVTLCDGTKVMISRALSLRANGVVFEGYGLVPHILVPPSLSDLRQGRDAALEAARKWLLSNDPLPQRDQRLRQ
jgi:carboxyl-terminal processing protease